MRLYGSGQFTLRELLEPAAQLAEQGFPVAPVTAHHWTAGLPQIQKWQKDGDVKTPLLGPDPGCAIAPGTIVTNPDLARVLRELGDKGAKDGFIAALPDKPLWILFNTTEVVSPWTTSLVMLVKCS